MKNQFFGLHIDFIGFSASLICALHCAALPFLLSMTPILGLQYLNSPWVEYTFILLSLVIASNALLHGYKRHHRRLLALVIVVIGFMLIGIGQLSPMEWQEILFTSSGGVTVAIAHLINWKHIKKSRVEYPDCVHSEVPQVK